MVYLKIKLCFLIPSNLRELKLLLFFQYWDKYLQNSSRIQTFSINFTTVMEVDVFYVTY